VIGFQAVATLPLARRLSLICGTSSATLPLSLPSRFGTSLMINLFWCAATVLYWCIPPRDKLHSCQPARAGWI